jgi:hypothetical protein
MYSAPEIYLAAILGAPNSPQEASALAPSRLKRLDQRLGGGLPPPARQGEMVAMSWACEMTALVRAKHAAGGRAIFFDFDAFLEQPAPMLSEGFAHLGISATETEIDAILKSPHIHRYSKAPEHPYDAQMRRAALQQARQLREPEIRNGMAWLERAASQFAPIEEAITIASRFKSV